MGRMLQTFREEIKRSEPEPPAPPPPRRQCPSLPFYGGGGPGHIEGGGGNFSGPREWKILMS